MVYGKALLAKNGHKKDQYYDEIGLGAQNIDTNVGSNVNQIGKVSVNV